MPKDESTQTPSIWLTSATTNTDTSLERHTIDMIVRLPPSADSKGNAYDAILVIVDRFTKMAKYFPIREMIAAPQLAELFCNEIVKQYGTLRSIVTDRGSIFTSEYWFTLCYYMKAKCKLSTIFYP